MPDKCLDCPAPSADMDGFIVSGPGGAPRSEGSGVSSPEGPFVREAPQTGHVVIMGTLGADGNPGSLPDAPQVGWAYVAEDAGEYGGVTATEGDMVYCMSLNPVKWGVLQADSDDSGRDLVSVSASFGCDPSPALSLTSAKASGASSVQTIDMSCLNGLYGAVASVDLSFFCGRGREQSWSPNAATVNLAIGFYGGTLPPDPGDIGADADFPASYGTFTIKGSEFDALASSIHTTSDTIVTVSSQGLDDLYYVTSTDDMSGCFSGNILVGTSFYFYDSYLGFRLESREELTSQDPGGPDIVCTFRLVQNGGDFLSMKLEMADGDSSTQIVDLSCMRPVVFDGSANGLVPASGAVQNYLLAGNGTWMRPMTDAEIDVLFA